MTLAEFWQRLGFGWPQYSNPKDSGIAPKLKAGDVVVKCTNTLLLSFWQRIRVLVGGSLVIRTQLCVTPENLIFLGSVVDMTVLPPGMVRSAAQIDAVNRPGKEVLRSER